MTPFVDDGDFRLYVGDVREVLAGLPDGSVDCVVTSPPYWGLRDYGTGQWAGGNPDCDHTAVRRGHGDEKQAKSAGTSRDRISGEGCRRCGATRTDAQIGLEATPELFVQQMVEVFREVRRVLAAHGTCWVNLGDSYAGSWGAQSRGNETGEGTTTLEGTSMLSARQIAAHPKGQTGTGSLKNTPGLKQKDLVGIPWRVAFALQQDGWWLRSDIVWAKSNPMPESVTDRPTKSHEYVFLLTKQPRYWFDQEAVREPLISDGRGGFSNKETLKSVRHEQSHAPSLVNATVNEAGRNVRSVWEIATQPYPDAHFATFPEALPDRCIRAGCPTRVCRTCGKPSERITDGASYYHDRDESRPAQKYAAMGQGHGGVGRGPKTNLGASIAQTLGWSDCGHNTWRPGTVLDPFMGSGTTALVARRLGRRSIGVELNEEYAALCARRLQQLSLFAEEAV